MRMATQQLAELGSMGVSMAQSWDFDEYCEVCKVNEGIIKRVSNE
jgi:hypothetical protein